MNEPVIIDACRTPIGTAGGALASQTVDQVATSVLRRLLESCPDPTALREVVLGNLRGPGGNLARYAALAAGVDPAVPGLTVDRQCGSGLAAIEVATWRLRGQAGFVLAGGAQSVSTQPLTAWPAVAGAAPVPFERAPFAPPTYGDPEMGEAADLLAAEHGITRARQDAYASRSHARAIAARASGAFAAELVPQPGLDHDERPRDGFTPERLARFRPVFRPDGTATAANACGVNDGAAGVLMVDAATHDALRAGGAPVPGLRVLGVVTTGSDPRHPGFGLVPAARAVLSEVGLGVDDLSAIECNEAFAGQVLVCLDALGIDEERNCAEGGALAIGHPWAASGAVLVTRLFSQLVRSGRGGIGLAAIAIAGGQGSAIVVEAC